MFTVKYQSFQPCAMQQEGAPTFYDKLEQVHGPFEFVSQEMIEGMIVVYAHREGGAPGMTFGPFQPPETIGEKPPRPTVWVMNASGATVAKYDL